MPFQQRLWLSNENLLPLRRQRLEIIMTIQEIDSIRIEIYQAQINVYKEWTDAQTITIEQQLHTMENIAHSTNGLLIGESIIFLFLIIFVKLSK